MWNRLTGSSSVYTLALWRQAVFAPYPIRVYKSTAIEQQRQYVTNLEEIK